MSDYIDYESDGATTVSFYEFNDYDSDNDTIVSLYEFDEEDKIKTNNTHISVVSFVIIFIAFILPYLY